MQIHVWIVNNLHKNPGKICNLWQRHADTLSTSSGRNNMSGCQKSDLFVAGSKVVVRVKQAIIVAFLHLWKGYALVRKRDRRWIAKDRRLCENHASSRFGAYEWGMSRKWQSRVGSVP